ncbi:MAG: hypothetical protein HY331_14625 [Chloroflexi bacterium]|nr:hypothetical protein [Chloroflexota bacterium]
MAAALAEMPEVQRKAMLRDRLELFAAMADDERRNAMRQMMAGVSALPEEKIQRILRTRTEVLFELPETTRMALMQTHMGLLQEMGPEAAMREMKLLEAIAPDLPPAARQGLEMMMKNMMAGPSLMGNVGSMPGRAGPTPSPARTPDTRPVRTRPELVLSLLALLAGGLAPIVALLLAATVGLLAPPLRPEQMAMMPKDMPQMMLSRVMWPDQVAMASAMPEKLMGMLGGMMAAQPVMASFATFVLVPALAVLGVVYFYARAHHPGLANCILAGLAAGAVATLALDAVRLTGFAFRWMPANLPPMFGMLILGPQSSPAQAQVVGYLYHFLNGASFGLVYTLAVGRGRVVWGIGWGVVVWLLMMITPPLLMMGVGPFGVNFGPGLVATTFIAHLAYGAALGWLAERWACVEGPVLAGRTAELRLSAEAHQQRLTIP